MAVITLGRLALGPPGSFVTEPVGDPVGTLGSTIVPAPRTAQQVVVDLNTIVAGATTLPQAQTIRRQLRSMMQNNPLKMQAFLYLIYSDDTEQNGWLVPQPANITSRDNQAWKVGLWEIVGGQWYLAGRQRGMREARAVWMKDLRTGLFERDALGYILSQDFNWLPALPLTTLPHGASSIENATNAFSTPAMAMPAGRDGGISQLVVGPLQPPIGSTQTNAVNPDLAPLSYERTEAQLNLSDVICYDRRGQATAPPGGPDTNWEEVYGLDYPWSWTPAVNLIAADVPVLDNGLVRVRYDSTNTPGFRVDVWSGAAYVEQGKMNVLRNSPDYGAPHYDDTWVSAALVEWTPDRAVMQCVLSSTADPYSRERIFVTVQRGEYGVTFEAYPALTSGQQSSDVSLQWTPVLNAGVPDLNESVMVLGAPPPTTVAIGSGGVAVSSFAGAGTLQITSTLNTQGWPISGTLTTPTTTGPAVITYTGLTGNSFTGCTTISGTGLLVSGAAVTFVYAGPPWAPAGPGNLQNSGPLPGTIQATAGTGGSGNRNNVFPALTVLGQGSFNGENWAALLRCPTVYSTVGSYQTTITVTQSANAKINYVGTETHAYGTSTNALRLDSQNSAGYVQAQVVFAATQAQQVLEGEAMTLGAGTTAPADTASGGASAQSASTVANNVMVSQATWPNGFSGTYRLFARVKTSASVLNIRAVATGAGGSTGGTVALTPTAYGTYQWVDLGDVVASGTLQIQAWSSAAATFNLDRIEAFLVHDRVRTNAIYSGSRDFGQAAQLDSRTLGALTAR
jgi:hypothetical protein